MAYWDEMRNAFYMYGACTLQAGNGYGSRLLCAIVQKLVRSCKPRTNGRSDAWRGKNPHFEVEIDGSDNINAALFRNFRCAEPGFEEWRCISIKDAAENCIQFRFVDGEAVKEYRTVLWCWRKD